MTVPDSIGAGKCGLQFRGGSEGNASKARCGVLWMITTFPGENVILDNFVQIDRGRDE
jgi:hypothetical protein